MNNGRACITKERSQPDLKNQRGYRNWMIRIIRNIMITLVVPSFLFLNFTAFAFEKCPVITNQNGHCISIRNHLIYVQIKGNKGPVVVFEAGRGDTHQVWDTVTDQVSQFARTVSYDRTNLGKSQKDPSMAGPITSRYIVKNLKLLLEKEHLLPPYILVGHSDGGLHIQLFARLYPQATRAVVLVDSASPYQTLNGPLPAKNDPAYQEALGFDISRAQLRKAPPFPAVPLIVLTASYHGSENPQSKFHLIMNEKPAVITEDIMTPAI